MVMERRRNFEGARRREGLVSSLIVSEIADRRNGNQL
jgi:hypothetical protein